MTWFSKGYETPKQESNGGGSSNTGRGQKGNLWRLRLYFGMENGRDILYLDDNPFRFFEHCGKDDNGHWNRFGICRRRNNIGDDCPPCGEKNINLYNIGFLTGIDISFAVGKEYRGERNYYLAERRLIGAKAGSTEYPGALADLHRIREREGRLRGLVIHQIRKGKKSPQIGDSFEVMERLEPKPEVMLDYIREASRKLYTNGTIGGLCKEAGTAMPSREWYTKKFNEIVFEAADYEKIFQPQSAADLANIFGLRCESQSSGATGGNDPFGYDDDFSAKTDDPSTRIATGQPDEPF
jgi:hypothetical protein